jgi:dolichol-phosphate mannosyltransferase
MAELARWPQLRLVRLLRNSGHQAALTAGLDAARGDLVVTMDADLQDPPECIPAMVDAARTDGVDVVYGVRSDRSSDTWFKRTTGNTYYAVMRRVAGSQVPHSAGDFRLVSRRVVEALGQLPEDGRVHRLVIPWFGFPSTEVRYARQERAAGRSKYTFSKMVALACDSLVAFSAAPLRFATIAGFVGVVLGVCAIVWSLVGWLSGSAVPGWTSILATTGLIGAVQLVCLGLLGEYVARIFTATHRRPTYLVGYDSAKDTGGEAGRQRSGLDGGEEHRRAEGQVAAPEQPFVQPRQPQQEPLRRG